MAENGQCKKLALRLTTQYPLLKHLRSQCGGMKPEPPVLAYIDDEIVAMSTISAGLADHYCTISSDIAATKMGAIEDVTSKDPGIIKCNSSVRSDNSVPVIQAKFKSSLGLANELGLTSLCDEFIKAAASLPEAVPRYFRVARIENPLL